MCMGWRGLYPRSLSFFLSWVSLFLFLSWVVNISPVIRLGLQDEKKEKRRNTSVTPGPLKRNKTGTVTISHYLYNKTKQHTLNHWTKRVVSTPSKNRAT